MAVYGLAGSHAHEENGMTLPDMQACTRAADRLDEVIIFRSTGPWSQRWLARGFPSKNFHVKGKSSDWGPQAGFVPYNGTYSKVGHNDEKARKGTEANDKGLQSRFAAKQVLALKESELQVQLSEACESPARKAIHRAHDIPNSKDLILEARYSGDPNRVAMFKAVWGDVWRHGSKRMRAIGSGYAIYVYPTKAGTNVKRLIHETPEPLEVMCSNEEGARLPMTGDYDMFAICPRWAVYNDPSTKKIQKPGIQLHGKKKAEPEAAFAQGWGMDKVLDPQLYMSGGGRSHSNPFAPKSPDQMHRNEHADMGNLTPRILRAINTLNAEMGAVGPKAGLRRVHHNAESHRHERFGAITQEEMAEGEGFPLTVFQPASLLAPLSPTAKYTPVCTLETYEELVQYFAALNKAGYYIPQSWVWRLPSQFAQAKQSLSEKFDQIARRHH